MDEKETESALVHVTETTPEVGDTVKADLVTPLVNVDDCPQNEISPEVSVKPIETAEEATSPHSNNIDDDKISNEILSIKDTEEAFEDVDEDLANVKSNTQDVKSSVADFPFVASPVVENNLDHSSPVNSIDCESQIENSVKSEIPQDLKQCDNVNSENVYEDVPIDNSVSELSVSTKDKEISCESTEKIDNTLVDDEKIDDAVVDDKKIDIAVVDDENIKQSEVDEEKIEDRTVKVEKIDAPTEDVKIDDSDGKDEKIGNDRNEGVQSTDICDDLVNVEEKVEKDIGDSVKLNKIVNNPVLDVDAKNENESNKEVNRMEVEDRTEASEVRQNGPDGSPENNEMDYDEKG